MTIRTQLHPFHRGPVRPGWFFAACAVLVSCSGGASGESSATIVGAPWSETHPEWSPDGARVAWISNEAGVRDGKAINFEVYVAEADGSNAQRLTVNDAFEADLAWSPQGDRLLVKSYRDGNDEVYLITLGDTTQRNLTNSPASDGGASWSPDGSTIVFHSDRDGATQLYLMDADGSNVRPVPGNPGPGHSPRFSPDGSRIAFHSGRDGNGEVYMVNGDGSNLRRITDDPRENGYTRWRPDGQAIVHTAGSFDTDRWSLVLTDPDGANSRVVADSVDSGNAAWSPDGSKLLFGRYLRYGTGGGDESRLFVLDLSSGQVHPLEARRE